MENKDFCVFILTHGRPDNVYTKKTLDKYNYTGKIYFVVDNEDKTYDKYVENFGKENVLLFDKKAMADSIDECNNFDNRKVIVHARNVCFKLAKELGIKYFVQFDDDYTVFRYRWIDKYMTKGYVQDLDRLFENILQYFIDTPFHTVCLAQGGDFIGGASCGLLTNYLKNGRKAMNSFFCSTDRYFQFVGQINEDVNTYTHLASKGLLMMTLPFVGLEQKQTQSNKGGMTDAYIKFGTYVKSFTTVLLQPSSVSVKMLTTSNARLHHQVNWGNTVPLIIDSKHKKC